MNNSTVATSNFSSSGLSTHLTLNTETLVPVVVFSLCFSVGVPGNIAVIVLRPNWEHLSSLSQSLMLNLVMSDLLCLLPLPVWIYAYLNGWTFGLVACKLLAYMRYCSIYSSLLTVIGLSVHRYLLVVHRQNGQRIKKQLLLFLLWLVPFILCSPTLVVRQLKTDQQTTECRPQYSSDAQGIAVLTTEAVLGFGAFSTVAVLYILLHKKINQTAFFNNPQTTRLVTSIIVCFFILWVPYLTIDLVGVAAISLKNEKLLNVCTEMWDIVGALTFFNSCLNPLLYAFTYFKCGTICKKKMTQWNRAQNCLGLQTSQKQQRNEIVK